MVVVWGQYRYNSSGSGINRKRSEKLRINNKDVRC